MYGGVKLKVKFIDVGRYKRTWEAACKGEITHSWLYKQVKKNATIMSKGIDFTESGAILVGGVRVVGRYEIVPHLAIVR